MQDQSAKPAADLVGVTNSGLIEHPMGRHGEAAANHATSRQRKRQPGRAHAATAAMTLLTVLGSLSGPAPAQAQPVAPLLPPPLAPACTSWQFPGGPVTLLYPPIGKTVFGVPAGTHVDASGQTIGDNGSPPLPVHVVGDILGHSFTLTVNRDNFEPLNFIGQIRDDNKAHGFYQIGQTGSEVNFQTAEPLVCQSAPEPPLAPAPAPAPAAAPAPAEPAKVAPTNAVHLSFDRDLVTWTANVTNSADLAGKCTYKATNPLLPGVNKSFTIDPNGTASFPVLAPPALSTYHVVVSCHGTFDGKDVEFGHEEQDVP